jgi:hypothetical protein
MVKLERKTKCCKAELHWHQFQGMRLVTEGKRGKARYQARCSACLRTFACDGDGKELHYG